MSDAILWLLAALAVFNFVDMLLFLYVNHRHGASLRDALTPGSGFRLIWKHRKGGAA